MMLKKLVALLCFGCVFCLAGDSRTDRMEAVTVRVLARGGEGVSAGSGFIVGDGSYVITNHHVIANGGEIMVLGKSLKVGVDRLYADSPEKDLAILHLRENSGRPAAVLVMHAGVSKTETVFAAGFPGAADEQSSNRDDFVEVKFSRGIISAFVRGTNDVRLYQTDAPINPGNSGGPLFDECGRVLGVNTMKSMGTAVVTGPDGKPTPDRVLYGEGVAWAIQADEVAEFLRSSGIQPQIQTDACAAGVPVGYASESHADGPPQGKAGASPGAHPNWILVTALVLGIVVLVGAIGYGVAQRRSDSVEPAPPPPFLNPNAKLRGLTGAHAGLEFSISPEPIVLGRDPGVSQIVFESRDGVVSKRHCSLRYDPSSRAVFVDDLGSTNGTYLENGERLHPGSGRSLPANSRFYLGDRDHMFEVREEIQ